MIHLKVTIKRNHRFQTSIHEFENWKHFWNWERSLGLKGGKAIGWEEIINNK